MGIPGLKTTVIDEKFGYPVLPHLAVKNTTILLFL